MIFVTQHDFDKPYLSLAEYDYQLTNPDSPQRADGPAGGRGPVSAAHRGCEIRGLRQLHLHDGTHRPGSHRAADHTRYIDNTSWHQLALVPGDINPPLIMLGNTVFFSAGRILKCQPATNKFKMQTKQVAVLLLMLHLLQLENSKLSSNNPLPILMSSNPPRGRRDGGAGARREQLPPRVRWSRHPRHHRHHLPHHPRHCPGQATK